MKATSLFCLSFLIVIPFASTMAGTPAKKSLSDQLQEAAQRATAIPYRLKYKWKQGETLRWRVVHLATTEATIRGTTQTSKVRTVSTKVWHVKNVDKDGNATFVHLVSDINAWQKVSDRPEVRYDSTKDKVAPPEFAMAAKTIGVPIATVTVSPTGRVIKRDHAASKLNLGLGGITLPLPEKPVTVGAEWFVPSEIRVRLEDGRSKRIAIRMVYTLRSVKTGVATIGVETQVLTPIDDPRVKSQLIQQLTRGEIKFDIDAGQVISRRIDWDETVVGFQGADSLMKYLARFTEELLPAPTTAENSSTTTR